VKVQGVIAGTVGLGVALVEDFGDRAATPGNTIPLT
jgi:hypothetical protein